jgi:hypothetical protein
MHTRIYNNHHSMICPCMQCQQARNAQTVLLPHRNNLVPVQAFVAEMVVAIDAETGRKRVYFWPIVRQY